MTMQLMPHQRTGADWLKRRNRAYLGDRPRVGKTLTLATAAVEIAQPNDTIMVACPAIVRSHWKRTLVDEAGWQGPLEVYSYDQLINGGEAMRELILHVNRPRILILDEAHLLKSFDAQRTKLLLGKGGYAREIPIVWAASGTPVPRHPGEWYTVGSTLFPSKLLKAGIAKYDDFEERFLTKISVRTRGVLRDKVVGLKNDAEFRALLDETMIQRTLDDIGDEQPKLLWQVLALDPRREDAIDIKRETASAVTPGLEWSQMYSTPNSTTLRRLVGMAKVPLVMDILLTQLAESDEKIVLFAHHRDVLHALQDGLEDEGIKYAYIDGSTSQKLRDIEIAEFRDDPFCRIFIGQNIACMMGIDLSAANTILSLEPDWVATNNDQMGHRILGPNQKSKHVVAQMIALAGTIDDSIVRQNAREAAWQDRMFVRS